MFGFIPYPKKFNLFKKETPIEVQSVPGSILTMAEYNGFLIIETSRINPGGRYAVLRNVGSTPAHHFYGNNFEECLEWIKRRTKITRTCNKYHG